MTFSLFLLLLIFTSSTTSIFATPPEPEAPLGAAWTMTPEQVEHLSVLEHTASRTLAGVYTIRGSTQTELVARWHGRAVSFYFLRNFGLYAISIAMVPQGLLHSQIAADQDLLDLEQCAPIRQAILSKYGPPTGLGATWDTEEISSPPELQKASDLSEWHFARNLLLWEGPDTRLALSDQSIWYVSKAGLTYREQRRQSVIKEGRASLTRETERQAQRQRQLDEAHQAIPSRAQEFESLFSSSGQSSSRKLSPQGSASP
jgi:hypothetical protein